MLRNRVNLYYRVSRTVNRGLIILGVDKQIKVKITGGKDHQWIENVLTF
ncbi:MAG: hypothetical protein WCK67_08285 [bacterium]